MCGPLCSVYNTDLKKRKSKIVPCISLEYKRIKVQITIKRNYRIIIDLLTFESLLNHEWVNEEIKEEIKFLKMNENANTKY